MAIENKVVVASDSSWPQSPVGGMAPLRGLPVVRTPPPSMKALDQDPRRGVEPRPRFAIQSGVERLGGMVQRI
jgi:hypothetical protein